MTPRALIAAELQELLDPDPLPGVDIAWVPAGAATPAGSFVALVPLLSRVVGRAELAGLRQLRIVANCAVGIDNIDLEACAAHGVVVTNTPDVLTDATADLTLALLLAAARRFKEGQALLEQGAWEGWDPRQLLGLELKGATLGIVGAGRIGQAVGHRAHAFGMRLCYTSRVPKPTFELETGALRLPLDALLTRSDVVTLHVPSLPTTYRLIGAKQLAGMRRGALLINTARGDVVDEEAVVSALESGHLGGAGLDVFAREPHVPDALVRHPRAVVLPHLGSATVRTRRAMAALAVRNVRAFLEGEPLVSPVVMPAGPGRW